MKTTTTIRQDSDEKALFRKAAIQAKEDLTLFFRNSAMLRIQQGMLGVKPEGATALVDRLFLEPYSAEQVSAQDAAEIEGRKERALAGKLNGPVIGRVLVKAPKRSKGIGRPNKG